MAQASLSGRKAEVCRLMLDIWATVAVLKPNMHKRSNATFMRIRTKVDDAKTASGSAYVLLGSLPGAHFT
jgi:hypothetical protein